jgi:alkanesulfonate monooxygenase SsuD/methylene tetrahydromethanopterin reductase-like flavin-dependent oxidoreductase (luciferase family)
MTVTFGFGLLTGQLPPGAAGSVADEYRLMLDLASEAEDSGFDAVWVSEHHGAEDGYLPSTLPVLAAVAAVTRRIRLGMAVALAPFQPPLRFAEDCAVVDQLSNGRLVVALGAGWRRREFDWFGIPIGERVARTTDLVAICRAAWTGTPFSFDGAHTSIERARVTPTPVGHLPIWLGGTVDAAAARAGRLGDGFFASPRADLDAFRRVVRAFDAAAVAAGRDPARLALAFHVDGWVSPDGRIPPTVLAGMRHVADTYAAWHAADDGRATPVPAADEAAVRRRGFMGSPAEVIAQAHPWIDEFGGRDLHIVIRLHYPGVDGAESADQIRRFASEVLPALTAPVGSPG